MVRLAAPITDLFVADDKVADVQVRSPTQIYVFGKGAGRDHRLRHRQGRPGRLFGQRPRRQQHRSIGTMLRWRCRKRRSGDDHERPGAADRHGRSARHDVEQATSLVPAFVGDEVKVVSRLKTATPLQVNAAGQDRRGEPLLRQDDRRQPAVGRRDRRLPVRHRPGPRRRPARYVDADRRPRPLRRSPHRRHVDRHRRQPTAAPACSAPASCSASTSSARSISPRMTAASHTLAEPNLTALSGETASFLAGGEFPIPISSGISGTTRSSTSNMASAWPSRRPCSTTAASRCASVRKCRSFATRARSRSTASRSRR